MRVLGKGDAATSERLSDTLARVRAPPLPDAT